MWRRKTFSSDILNVWGQGAEKGCSQLLAAWEAQPSSKCSHSRVVVGTMAYSTGLIFSVAWHGSQPDESFTAITLWILWILWILYGFVSATCRRNLLRHVPSFLGRPWRTRNTSFGSMLRPFLYWALELSHCEEDILTRIWLTKRVVSVGSKVMPANSAQSWQPCQRQQFMVYQHIQESSAAVSDAFLVELRHAFTL